MLAAVAERIIFGVLSVSAVFVGVARNRPARIGPWVLLASAVASLVVGDVCSRLGQRQVADLWYFAMFLLVAFSLLQLTHGGAILADRARLIDLLAFTCSTVLVLWVAVIGPKGDLGAVSAADMLGDLLLVVVAGRLSAATRWRNPAALLLAVGALGLLAGDVAYPLGPNLWTELGFVVVFLAWGAAALHPSMAALTEPAPVQPSPWRGRWAGLLGVSVATPPAVLLIEAVSGQVTDGLVIAAAAGITLVLAIARLSDSVTQNSQAAARERGLREASAALVAAGDLPAVDEAVRDAVAMLTPPASIDRVVFAADDRQLTLAALPVAAAGTRSRSWFPDAPPAGSGAEATLICPLWLEPLAVARPNGGALVLAGRRDALVGARDTLEVLAGQAALALDRICLVEAVGRRDSDLYLRAVVRNTADMMVIIDEDQRIRYASQALRQLLGDIELDGLATLDDLVHDDDRAGVRQALNGHGDGTLFCALRRADRSQVLVEATYRDLREDRLVQGFVLTLRDVTASHTPDEHVPHVGHLDELPAWVNRRSARHKFRF